jgi:hypothetical protein
VHVAYQVSVGLFFGGWQAATVCALKGGPLAVTAARGIAFYSCLEFLSACAFAYGVLAAS